MSRARGPRRHYHLSRESIAEAALAIVDREGVGALNMRALAASLGVGTSTLYRFVLGRDEILTDVVGLLVDEIDVADVSGENWEQAIRRVAHSVHRMALRHPLAFELVALAPESQGPLLEHVRQLKQMLVARGLPAALFPEVWNVIDAFITGFTLLGTRAIYPLASAESDSPETPLPIDRDAVEAHLDVAFRKGLDVVIAGLCQTLLDCAEPPRSI